MTQIDYDELVQDALRGVVRDILRRTATDGLPGEHHFYIAFRTRASGVDLPDHLKERYPDEMTIVLQHKFWGLEVEQDWFKVGLSFNQQPEMITIPFKAVVGFVDPSVQFALQFQDPDLDDETGVTSAFPVEAEGQDVEPETEDPKPPSDDGGNVVTLDAFRKKP